jgi:hypothetical protein
MLTVLRLPGWLPFIIQMSSEPPCVALNWGSRTERYVGREIGAVLPVPGSSAASIFLLNKRWPRPPWGLGSPEEGDRGRALFLGDRERPDFTLFWSWQI